MESRSTSRSFLEIASGVGLLAVGAAALLAANRVRTPTRPDPSALGSRPALARHDFVLTQLGSMRRDQFLLDRTTGRVWQSVCDGEVNGPDCKGSTVFEEVYVSDVTPDSSVAAKLHGMSLPSRGP